MIHANTNGLFTQAVKFVGKRVIDIFVKCNWVDTRWQQYGTHLHTNSTQNIEQHS